MKRQTRKVGVAGGFFNQIMGNNASEPIVGEGATILMYSDREPYQVIDVSEDGMTCTIQAMNYKFVGSGYGDERYELSDNPNGYTRTIGWNDKKKSWGYVGTCVRVIKARENEYYKKYGYGWFDIFLKDNNLNREDISGEDYSRNFKLIEGVTKEYKTFSPISILFGEASKYRDPSF